MVAGDLHMILAVDLRNLELPPTDAQHCICHAMICELL